jgi:hypothetical protein
MRKSSASALVLAAAAATTLAVTTPAFAATWTVSSGGTITGTLSGTATLRDTTTGQNVTCTVATASGSIPNGTGLAGAGIGKITASTFGTSATKCSGPLGSSFTAVLTPGTTWKINAVSYNATTGVTSGTITGVSATVTGSSLFGACDSVVTGSANTATYTNSTHVLKVAADATPALTISSVTGSGCVGLINNNDKATLAASFTISPSVKITSP